VRRLFEGSSEVTFPTAPTVIASQAAVAVGVLNLQFLPVAAFAAGTPMRSDPKSEADANASTTFRIFFDVILSTFPEG
jgi:hypothetical protein